MRTPLEDWHADESNRNDLAHVLNLPVVKVAMSLLQWLNLPRHDHIERPSADAITFAAMERVRIEGFFDYAEQLLSLTEPPAPALQKPPPDSEEHVLEYAKSRGLIQE